MSEHDPRTHASGAFVRESRAAESRNLKGKQQLGPSIASRFSTPEIHPLHSTPGEDRQRKHGNDEAMQNMFMREVSDYLKRCKHPKNGARYQKERNKPR